MHNVQTIGSRLTAVPMVTKVEKLRVRDRARRATTTASERQATLQRKSTRKAKHPRREERG